MEFASPSRRRSDGWTLARFLIVGLAVIGMLWFWAGRAGPGIITATDGDSVTLENGGRGRLWGIDAVELSQTCNGTPCGKQARDHLADLLTRFKWRCSQVDIDRYKRLVVRCTSKDGIADLGGMMVADGYARDYERYSHGHYAQSERMAKINRRGVWATGDFPDPAAYRREHPR